MKAPTPARVAWQRDSWPPIPVIKVIERKIVEKAIPELKTFSHVFGIQVSIDTTNAPSSTYHATRMTRSISGARSLATAGGGGGSTEASGSLVWSSLRSPGTKTSASTKTTKGSEVKTADDQTLEAGRYPWSTVSSTPIRIPTSTAIGIERNTPQAAAAMAATNRVA